MIKDVYCKSEIYENGMDKMDFTVGHSYSVNFRSEYECVIEDDYGNLQWFSKEEIQRFFREDTE